MEDGKIKIGLLEIGITGYLLIILFNGYLRHLSLSIEVLGRIRPYLPEVFIVFILLEWIKSGTRIKKIEATFITYILCICLLNIPFIPSVKSVLSTVRDLFEPLILVIVISNVYIRKNRLDCVMNLIKKIFTLFILAGFLFAIKQYVLGWEWTSKYFAGYSFWGLNKEESLRVTNGWLGLKVLGTTGSAETFGFYNALSILYLLYYGHSNKKINRAIIIVAFVNVLLSGMKTPLLIILVILFARVFLPEKKKMRFADKVGICLFAIIIFMIMIFAGGTWTESSMYARLVLWKELLEFEHVKNLVVPTRMFYYSAATGNTGIISFWDNTFLYLAFSIGMIGLILLLYIMFYYIKKIAKLETNKLIPYMYVFLALSSITTCIFYGRNFVGAAGIILGLRMANARRQLSEK